MPDKEFMAIQKVFAAIADLDWPTRERILRYALSRVQSKEEMDIEKPWGNVTGKPIVAGKEK